MKQPVAILVLVSGVVLALSGCVTAPGLKYAEFNQRVKAVKLGMTKDEFDNVFPESISRGAKNYTDGPVEVREVPIKEWNFMHGEFSLQPTWFYFFSSHLIQFGKPDDWPANPKGTYTIKVEKK